MIEMRLAADKAIQCIERPVPAARGDWVLVKLLSVPMCNEYHGYAEGKAAGVLGHEAAGVVEDPAASGRFKAGDRVAVMPQLPCGHCRICLEGEYIHCRQQRAAEAELEGDAAVGTFAQYMLKPADQLVPVPDAMPLDHAAMACCGLGPSFGALERMQVDGDAALLVSGLGPVGLGAVINGRHRKSLVVASDPNPWRRQLALDLGADHVIDPSRDGALAEVMDLTGGRGADVTVECSGTVPGQEFCIEAAAVKGRVAVVGSSKGHASVHLGGTILFKGLTIIGSWHYNRAWTHRLLDQIGLVGDSIDRMITHRFALTNLKEAWELQCTGQCGKVVLQPW